MRCSYSCTRIMLDSEKKTFLIFVNIIFASRPISPGNGHE